MKQAPEETVQNNRQQTSFNSFLDVVDKQASQFPGDIAYTFLTDGETEELNLTFSELQKEAKKLAHVLLTFCAPGDRLILSFNHGLDFIKAFYACLYAGVVAVPSVPPKSTRSLDRLSNIMTDSGARIILSHSALALGKRASFFTERNFKLVQVDEDFGTKNTETTLPTVNQKTLAFLQYTSGSTGSPKGVMITHENILSNIELISTVFAQTKNSVVLSWLPFYHDMGLIGGVLVPMYNGAKAVLMSPIHFTQKPLRWLKAIHRYRATTSGGPNFGFELCVENAAAENLSGLDLSSWKVAFVGAEPVRINTLQNFSNTFEAAGFTKTAFQPCYGMAETTLLISASRCNTNLKISELPQNEATQSNGKSRQSARLVSCGIPHGFELRIVNDKGNKVENGNVGEIVVNGTSVSGGYWNQPELTETIFKSVVSGENGHFLKTGDLGFIKDGELYITGRLKDIVIINGRNLYPQDIEAAITSNVVSAVKDACAAFSINTDTSEDLIIVSEVTGSSHNETIARIKEITYEEFEIFPSEIVLLRRGTIPKTTSGKIQRHACKRAFIDNTLNRVAGWNSRDEVEIKPVTKNQESLSTGEINTKVIETLSALTGLEKITGEENLFSLGLNSIKLAQFVMLLNDEFNTDLSIEFIFENPLVGSICSQLEVQLADKPGQNNIASAGSADFYELSPVQHGIWFDQQLKPGSNSYNIPVVLNLNYIPETNLVSKTVNQIIAGHEILRTVFRLNNDLPVQVILNELITTCQFVDFSNVEDQSPEIKTWLSGEIGRQFDLENGPLIRYGVIKLAGNKSKLFLVAHHLIEDGTSLFNLLKEIIKRTGSPETNVQEVNKAAVAQYKDYASWVNKNTGAANEAKAYWENKFSEGIMPFSPARSSSKKTNESNNKGKSLSLVIPSPLASGIRSYVSKNENTTYAFMLSAFAVLMQRFSAKKELVIGVPVSGREKQDTLNMLGTFINAVMVPFKIQNDTSFAALLGHAKSELMQAIRYQNYPLHLITRELKNAGKLPGGSLTTVYFNGLGFIDKEYSLDAFESFSENYGLDMNLDLNVYVFETENNISLRFDYKESCFDKNTMNDLMAEYMDILSAVISDPGQVILSAQSNRFGIKKSELLKRTMFSNGSSVKVSTETIATQIEKHALINGTKTALVFKNDSLSYAALNAKANALAYKLKQAGITQGDFVPLLMNKSIELPLSILAIMKLGAAFVPLDTGWPAERIKLLLDKLNPKLVLLNNQANGEGDSGYTNVLVNQKDLDENQNNPAVSVDVNSPIYGMYTSGTTGIPKCAVNLHKGILNRFAYMNKMYGCSGHDTILFTSRHIYDASVWQMFWPLTNGARTIIPDDTFGLDLHEIIDLVEKEKVTVTDFVPSVFSIFVDYVESHAGAAERVKTLRQLLIGGEAMHSGAVSRFRKIHPTVGITNTYGPTEASIGTIFYEVPEQIPDVIPIGKPIDNVIALLLDDDLVPVPLGELGQLYLGGVCLGTGYLNDVERTDAVFVKNLLQHIDSEFLYKTGDLASYLEDGNLHYAGRADTQVKINGIRVECSEIESTLLMHEAVKDAVVLCKQDSDGKNFLVGILRLANNADLPEVQEYLRRQLPAYMVPKGFTLVEHFPKTLNGKADRKALDKLEWQRTETSQSNEVITDETELKLLAVWETLLDNRQLKSTSDFFESGGDSLKAMQLLSRIHKALDVNITLREIFLNPTIKEQAKIIRRMQGSRFLEISPVPTAPYYPLSHSQKRLWVLSKFPESRSAYNMPAIVELDGALNSEALQNSLSHIYNRHESLRTGFVEIEGLPYQKIAEPSALQITHSDFSKASQEQLRKHINEQMLLPFDLEKSPLVRAELINTGKNKHLFLLLMHHIISDGWSMGVIVREILELYDAAINNQDNPLRPLKIQYKDFAAWQEKLYNENSLDEHKKYWLKQFKGELPVLELPADRPRPASKTYNGGRLRKKIETGTLTALRQITGEQKVTLYMSLLSAVNVLLYRYSGQDDIIIGSPQAGRDHADLENQVGFYANTLALRTKLNGDEDFASLLEHVKGITLGAYEHQAFPFDKLVDELALPRNMSRNPLFDVMVVLQNAEMGNDYNKRISRSGIKVNDYENENHVISKFDLTFTFSELNNALDLLLEYNSDLYDKETIERMAGHFGNLLQSIIENPLTPLNELNYISGDEREQILHGFNTTASDFIAAKSLISLFEENVNKTPAKTALVFKEKEFSFSALNEKANQLAHYLKKNFSILKNDLVGIKLERSEWMIISILATLKAGGAYVPIDPDYPEERIKYMLEDSNCKVLIDANEIEKFLKEEILFPKTNLPLVADLDSLAYVIYTSGSTGRPKGCMLQNRGVLNRIDWMWNQYGYNGEDVILQKTTFTFDVSVWEIFMPLCWGTKMILCEKDDIASPERIVTLIQKHAVSCLHFVPSVLNLFVSYLTDSREAPAKLISLKRIITSGEALAPDTVKQWYKHCSAVLHNLYGPTEASVDVTYYETKATDKKIPIGRPIWNTAMYVLDKKAQLVPIGVPGEICIGGIGLAKGYLNKPELTAEKFVTNPFNPNERIYKTGDIGRWLADGNIEYMGRKDDQVKIRGYRIELGEIENCLQQHPAVTQAVVQVVASGDNAYLIAYVLCDATCDAEALTDFVKQMLPAYMVPAQIVFINEMPLNNNGKADRKKLKDLYQETKEQAAFIEPDTDEEKRLAAIWCEVLKLEKVGATENFFSLGGNSLNATQVISRVRDEFKVELPFKALFDDPTITKIAKIIGTLEIMSEEKMAPIKRVAR